MSQEDKMTIEDRRKYLSRMQQRYRRAGRKARSELLDEMAVYTGLHRKSLVRLMRNPLVRKARAKHRGRSYGRDVDGALCVIAESHDDICAERLQPTLVTMALELVRHGELEASDDLLQQLGCISVSTVRRRLSVLRPREARFRVRKPPSPPNPALRHVPMGRISWRVPEPGHFEADLVNHCGSSSSGLYVSTLQMIDVAVGWSERVAVLGRSYLAMEDAFQVLLSRIPFPVLEIHPDNDSAFFNQHLLRFFGKQLVGARLSRSRPYHKNDNRFVEQGNSSLVRAYLGHERLDTVAQTWALNVLYDRMWLYHNAYQPVMRQQEKLTIDGQDRCAPRSRPIYDQARTPLERAIATGMMRPGKEQALTAAHDTTNPRVLRAEIYDRLDYLFSLPRATSQHSEDVRLTLRSRPFPEQGELARRAYLMVPATRPAGISPSR